MQKLKYEEVYEMFLSRGLILLDTEYSGSSKLMKCIDKDGFLGRNSYSDVKNGNLFLPILKTNPYTLINMQLMLDKNYKNCKIVNGEYIGRNNKTINLKCNICNHPFTESWERLQSQNICCPECRKIRKQEISKERMNDIYELIDKIEDNGIKILNPQDYNGMHFKLKAKCLDESCGHIWEIAPNNAKRRGCPKCNDRNKKLRYRLSSDEIINKINENNPNIIIVDLSMYENSKGKILCSCKKHNKNEPFYARVDTLIRGSLVCYDCYIDSVSGENNWAFNTNITAEERVLRRYLRCEITGMSTSDWRIKVFNNDNFTCKICNNRGNILNAHHLNGWHWCKEGRFDIDNGVTLCEDCHKEFHSIFGSYYNTKEQFEEYINLYKDIS